MSALRFQKQVAQRIKQLRLRRGLKQKDFTKFGYTVRHYQKIENGNLNLTLKTLFKISRALNADVRDFLHDEKSDSSVFQELFYECPVGIIVWKLEDVNDPDSITLYEHNRYGAKAVYRDLANSKGMRILEIFPRAREQGVPQMLFEVITTGKPKYVSELIRHDQDFPLTVFTTEFVKCGSDLGAAIFTDITDEFLARQEVQRHKKTIEQFSRLPVSESTQVRALKEEVDALLKELGRPAKYGDTPL